MNDTRLGPVWLTRLCDYIFTAIQMLVVLLLSVMLILVFGNVLLRYGFNSGIIVSEELSRWCLLWLTYSGALVALRNREHLSVTMGVAAMGPRLRRVSLTLAYTLMIVTCIMFMMGAWSQTMLNMSVSGTVVPLSLAFFYGTGVFFGAGATLILLVDLYRIAVLNEDILRLDAPTRIHSDHDDPDFPIRTEV